MDYNRWLRAEDIPTIRRLDYVVKNTDGFESGKLYAALRNLTFLNKYKRENMNDEEMLEVFKEEKIVVSPKLEWVNEWMELHDLDVIFTDVNSWKAVGEDYNYFWNLKTEKDFIRQEAEARLGISKRKPVKNDLEKYEEQVCEMVNKLRSEQQE